MVEISITKESAIIPYFMKYEVEDPSGLIDNLLGKSFGPLMAFAGYPIAFFGLFGFFSDKLSNIIFGFILFLGGSFVATVRDGIQIDLINNRFREYTLLFLHFKVAKWRSLYEFPYVVVLRLNESQKAYSMTAQSVKFSELKYEVFLMDENHVQRILVCQFDLEDKAFEYAQQLAAHANLQYAEYNPATSRRRRRR